MVSFRSSSRANVRVAASIAAGALAIVSLAGCGSTSTPVTPRANSAAEREWIDNAVRFVGTLDSDLELSANGGANLATARRALEDESAVYSMLVAYTLFGSCSSALANVGTPSDRDGRVVQTLSSACRHLEHASQLFTNAMSRHSAHDLLVATNEALDTGSLLTRAKTQLNSLRTG